MVADVVMLGVIIGQINYVIIQTMWSKRIIV